MTSYSYTSDSQLLQHYGPDILHSESQNISAVIDENGHPLVFSITTADKGSRLALTFADLVTGKNISIDLTSIFKEYRAVTALAAFQDEAQMIYLTFAVRATRMTDMSNLYVCAPATATTWKDPAAIAKLRMASAGMSATDVSSVFFAPCVNAGNFHHDSNYPLLAVEHRPGFNNAQSAQVDRVKVSEDNKWSFAYNQVSRPSGVINVLDQAILRTSTQLLALFTLYQFGSSGSIELAGSFYDTVGQVKRAIIQYGSVPQDTRCLGVFSNRTIDKTNDLLLSGDGLYHYQAIALGTGSIAPKRLIPPTSNTWKGSKALFTSQSMSNVALWSQTSQLLCTATLELSENGTAWISETPVPIHNGATTDLAPVFRNIGVEDINHQLLFLNEVGQHILLQWKPVNEVWEEQRWLITDLSTVITDAKYLSIAVYDSNIAIQDANGYPAAQTTVTITSTDVATVTINGTRMLIGTTPKSIQTDLRGNLSIISPVDSLGSTTVMQFWHGQKRIGADFDPSSKVKASLAKVNGDYLKTAHLQDDPKKDPVVPAAARKTPEEIEDIGNNVNSVHSTIGSLPTDGTLKQSPGPQPQSIFGSAWRAWHFIEMKADAVANIVKDDASGLITVLINVVGSDEQFLVNSIGRAMKAISLVLKQVAVDLDRIVEWIGYLFEWADIKATQQALVSATTTTFTRLRLWVHDLVPKLDEALDSADEAINTLIDKMKPPKDANAQNQVLRSALLDGLSHQTSKPANVTPNSSMSHVNNASTSSGGQWSNNHLNNGDICPMPASNPGYVTFQLEPEHHDPSLSPDLALVTKVSGSTLSQKQVTYPMLLASHTSKAANGIKQKHEPGHKVEITTTKTLDDIIDDIETTATDLGKGIFGVAHSSLENIGHDILNVILQFIEDLVKTLKDLMELILDYVNENIDSIISGVLESEIQIPFISALWKSEGYGLPNALDLYCILLAIPITAMGKIVGSANGLNAWPDLAPWITTLSGTTTANVDPKAMCIELKTLLDNPDSAMRSEVTSKHNPGNGKQALSGSADPSASEQYSQACCIAHAWATGLEMALTFAVAECNQLIAEAETPATKEPLEAKKAEFERYLLLAEGVALTFSFPNLDDEETPLIAKILEGIAFLTRAVELFGGFWIRAKPPNNPKSGPIFNIFITVLEMALSAASTSFRMDKLRKESGDNEDAIGQNIMEFVNIAASFAESICCLTSELEPNPEADFLACVFMTADFGLDAGRGIWEFVDKRAEHHHCVTY